MASRDWNEDYAQGHPPWDTGQPDEHLLELVRQGAIPPGRALEVGCGTGTNSAWLAEQGFSVVGVDVAPLAVEAARTRARGRGLECTFEVLDFLSAEVPGGPFDFAFDRGCFHVFDAPEARARFAERIAALLRPGGVWLSLIGSTEGAPRDVGPPRRSARDVLAAIEPALELLELRSTVFETTRGDAPAAWVCRSRLRSVPAQPSTVRD
ncbi:MAG: class I SAM-dependent methyltransferase [Planctomycetes bacterium]|nr:class I SAM-dependent methyltransferase [Planctomycetota bacterium]